MNTLASLPTLEFKTDDEGSHAKVRIAIDADNAYLSKEVSVYASADNSDSDIYLAVRQHTYASVGDDETISSNADLISGHRFTRLEAEMIVKALSAELAR